MNIEIKYDINSKVFITELERPGVVNAIHLYKSGTYYTVRYFDNGDLKTVDFLENEIKEQNDLRKPAIKNKCYNNL